MACSRSTRAKPKEKRQGSILIEVVGAGNRRATLIWVKREQWRFTISAAPRQRSRRKRGRSSRDDVFRERASQFLPTAESSALDLVTDSVFGDGADGRRNRFWNQDQRRPADSKGRRSGRGSC